MSEPYYQPPLNLGEVMRQQEMPRINLRESISRWLHILFVTRYGECKHDEAFGCQIWEHDFENITNMQKFKEELTRSIVASVAANEPRLTDVKAETQIEQVEYVLKNRRIKIRIGIRVRGTIRKTNETFVHLENFFVGPLSYF
ncbi:MAG: GPW/gp25 family protein [Bacteroidales bacterium]